MANATTIPGCLGQMRQWYCQYCSAECPLAALCALLVMGQRQRRDYFVLPFEDLSEQEPQ